MSIDNNGSTSNLMATGGGNATALGTHFQASVGAIYLSKLLTQSPLESSLSLGGPNVRWIRFESETPIDDVLIATSQGGFVAIQAKTTLSISTNSTSEFYKTVEQIARHWLVSKNGGNTREWDRPLDQSKDRMVIAVGQNCSSPVRVQLAEALNRTREAFPSTPLTQIQTSAITSFRDNLRDCWPRLTSVNLTQEIEDEILCLTAVVTFDVDGGHWAAATTSLQNSLPENLEAHNVIATLRDIASELMGQRSGLDESALRRMLSERGILLQTSFKYQEDIAKLKNYGKQVHQTLTQYQKIDTSEGLTISIPRSSRRTIKQAAEQGSLLIIGEPGAGKSAAINDLATDLTDAKYDVLQLAVDNLRVDSLGSLNLHLGISHSLLDVLENWEGPSFGFILIDALDASRGGVSESIFRSLIEQIITRNWRWKVVASIRSFDLQLGVKFKSLFKGIPPASDLMDRAFSNVRHVLVPKWGDEEVNYLVSNAPNLGRVITALPARLKELATIPFNVRLISELLTGGAEPVSFESINSEVELLNLYWEQRIGRGLDVQACLNKILTLMINHNELRAEKAEVISHCDTNVVQRLLEQGVLIESENERYIHFRHHLLFDYAASRAYLSVGALTSGAHLFNKKNATGLMLAPALRFILRDMWYSDITKKNFWKAIVNILKFEETDPVMKSVASRICAELTSTSSDIVELIEHARSDMQGTCVALSHIIGALAVRAEDKDTINCEAWCYLAAKLATLEISGSTVWPIRNVLFIVYERATILKDRINISIAANLLLNFGFQNTNHPSIADAGLRFVTETFDINPTESKSLLRKIFEIERFKEFAHQDLPTLAYRVSKVIPHDPEFGVEIYSVVYGRDIEDSKEKSMSNSQILPLITTTAQDYSMARYSLKEYFKIYLEKFPVFAVKAMIKAVDGYIQRKHTKTGDKIEVVLESGVRFSLTPDFSYIWASDINGTYAEDAVELVVEFTKYFSKCEARTAADITEILIAENSYGWLWARLFMETAKRPELATRLWRYATHEVFLMCSDTLKDAIDLIKTAYPNNPKEINKAFELSLFEFDFSQDSSPEAAKQQIISRVASVLGGALVTDELKAVIENEPATEVRAANRRLYSTQTISSVATDDLFWFSDREKLAASPNKELHDLINKINSISKSENQSGSSTSIALMEEIRPIINGMRLSKQQAGIDGQLVAHAEGKLAELCLSLIRKLDFKSPENAEFGVEILDLVTHDLALSTSPVVAKDTEANFADAHGWGAPAARVTAAEITLDLAKSHRNLISKIEPLITQFLVDPHPAVRMVTASSLTMLWEVDKNAMWRFATSVASTERNYGVLLFYVTNFLNRVIHTLPETVERLLISLYENAKADQAPSKNSKEVLKEVGSSLLWLAISYNCKSAEAIVETFLKDPVNNKSILTNCLHSLRSGLTLGYGKNNPKEDEIRKRCQAYALECASVMAAHLKAILDIPDRGPLSDAEANEVRAYSELLDLVCREYFFASGASESQDNEGAMSPEFRPIFLNEIEPALRVLGDYGSPHTIYYLLQLMEYLAPSQPIKVFDLTSHALLNAGRKYGYQNEVLGTDLMVRVIGRLLADHREIFENPHRRQQLIECLESFLTAGWPSARKLLYHLPELLQ